jgi:hypothetical protein
MDPLVQLVKDLLETADPHIRVVECQPVPAHPSAQSCSDLTVKPLDPDSPDDISSTNRK